MTRLPSLVAAPTSLGLEEPQLPFGKGDSAYQSFILASVSQVRFSTCGEETAEVKTVIKKKTKPTKKILQFF